MADGQRINPVNRLVLHHSVGPDFTNVDHDTIAKWFSDIGKTRGYAGTSDSKHYYTPSNGKRYMTYSQAHMAGHWHGGKYCLFDIMDDKWNNVAWHASNWAVNQRSIGIENCGNYVAKTFTDAQRQAVADFWRPQDKKLNGATYINGHKDFSATACPGRIAEAIPSIVNYINNPPTTTPPPTPTDPCKDVKADLAACEAELLTAQKELDATQKELADSQTELEACKNNEVPPVETPCEVVKGMSVWDIIKCKIG